MKAINFNNKINTLTEGIRYDFEFNGNKFSIYRAGNDYAITNGATEVKRSIFRNDMRVMDALAVVFHKAGRATSGAVYRADILQDFRDDYGPNIYTGVNAPSMAQGLNRRTDTPESWGVGFELEVAERTGETLKALQVYKSNIWQMVTDGSIGEVDGVREYRANERRCCVEGIEFTSALLDPIHAINPEFYRNFCTQLTGLATSKTNASTGLHCSISREAFGTTDEAQDEAIARLVYLCNWIIPNGAQEAIFGRPTHHRWARTNQSAEGTVDAILKLAQKAPRIMNDMEVRKAFAADLLTGNKCRTGHTYPEARYHRINITNKERVEFRQGKGDINAERLALIAQFVITSSRYAAVVKLSKMSLKSYYESVPTSSKYATLRAIIAQHMSE